MSKAGRAAALLEQAGLVLMPEGMDELTAVADSFTRYLIGDRKLACKQLGAMADKEITYYDETGALESGFNKLFTRTSKSLLKALKDDVDVDAGVVDSFTRYLIGDRKMACKQLDAMADDEITVLDKNGMPNRREYSALFGRVREAILSVLKAEMGESADADDLPEAIDHRKIDKARADFNSRMIVLRDALKNFDRVSADEEKIIYAMPNGIKHFSAVNKAGSVIEKELDYFRGMMSNMQDWDASKLEESDEITEAKSQIELIAHYKKNLEKVLRGNGAESEYVAMAFYQLRGAIMGKSVKDLNDWAQKEMDRLKEIELDNL